MKTISKSEYEALRVLLLLKWESIFRYRYKHDGQFWTAKTSVLPNLQIGV